MNKDLVGQFFADINSSEFYIMTEEGNYIYSDPLYGGDNTLKKTNVKLKDWREGRNVRVKCQYVILDYIDADFKLEE